MSPARRTSGFTLIELLLALGLFSLLALALVRLIDTSLTVWNRTEASRELSEMGASIVDLLSTDLRSLEHGTAGDLLGDWQAHDLNGDGVAGASFARLRLRREASAVELSRQDPGASIAPGQTALVEIAWALVPSVTKDPHERPLGTLLRGERRAADTDGISCFEPDFFDARGLAPDGALRQVTGGVLWFAVLYAAPTTLLDDGWHVGLGLDDCAASWDAWGRDRPDAERSPFNHVHAGVGAVEGSPVFPRRVRVELELERPLDLRHRTRCADTVDPEMQVLRVRDGRRLPGPDAHVLMDEEWMRIVRIDGDTVTVQRGQRGTRPAWHDPGALVHYGRSITREIPIDGVSERWTF